MFGKLIANKRLKMLYLYEYKYILYITCPCVLYKLNKVIKFIKKLINYDADMVFYNESFSTDWHGNVSLLVYDTVIIVITVFVSISCDVF